MTNELVNPLYSVRNNYQDTVDQIGDSLMIVKRKSDLETKVFYKCKDSIVFDTRSSNIYMFGNTSVDYGDISLTAAETKVNWITKIVDANHVKDSTDRKIGKPVFTQSGKSYEANSMSYHFQTRKANIQGVATQLDDAYIQGKKVKKSPDNDFYIQEAKYTTCNLENPHFHIHSRRLKVVPGRKIISGPFNMRFREITTPLGFFFGFFPQPKKQADGFIIPSYGEERRRGFYLRDGGYYTRLSDYVDLKFTGDVFTNGSYGYRLNSTYKKRYKFNGGINYRFMRNSTLEFEEGLDSKDFAFSWRHSPQSRGTSRFSSSVNIQTSSFFQNSNENIYNSQANIRSQFTSNVSYSKTFRGTPFSLSTNLRHSQNVQTGLVSLTLPSLNFNTQRQYPFKNWKLAKKTPLEKLSLSHTMTLNNRVSNGRVSGLSLGGKKQLKRKAILDSLLPFERQNYGLIWERSQFGATHRVPISTSFTILKFLTASPNLSYTEIWAPKELEYEYDSIQDGFNVYERAGFSRAGWYSMGTSITTRLYGFVYFKKGKISAIRHVMNPSVSFSYSPDFSHLYESVRVNGREDELLLSKFQGMGLGNPPIGENGSLSFSLTNNLEMKVKDDSDSTKQFKKVNIFDNLSFRSGYNFLADSFRLQNIGFSVGVSLFNRKISINGSGTIDPYLYELLNKTENTDGSFTVRQRRLDEFKWNRGAGLGQVTNFRVATGFNFRPKGKSKGNQSPKPNEQEEFENDPLLDEPDEQMSEEEKEIKNHIYNNPEEYVDFSIPWSINTSYALNYSKRGFEQARITQSLTFSGQLSLTEKTAVSYRSGYDFENKKFTQTSFNVSRDLHCWALTFSWVPFGRFQSYNLLIRAKSPILQDLKLEKRRNFQDSFGGF